MKSQRLRLKLTEGDTDTPLSSRRGRDGDEGATIIEVLLAIMLLGLIVAGTLTSLATTIKATAIDRDHANAHAWLQTAADMLYARGIDECTHGAILPAEIASITAEYESTIQQTENPEGWSASNIKIMDLQYWRIDQGPDKTTVEGWGDMCDSQDTNLQRVLLEVRGEDGKIVEQVEVIIGE